MALCLRLEFGSFSFQGEEKNGEPGDKPVGASGANSVGCGCMCFTSVIGTLVLKCFLKM